MTSVTQKHREKKVIFSSKTGQLDNFFTYARHDVPEEPMKSTPTFQKSDILKAKKSQYIELTHFKRDFS